RRIPRRGGGSESGRLTVIGRGIGRVGGDERVRQNHGSGGAIQGVEGAASRDHQLVVACVARGYAAEAQRGGVLAGNKGAATGPTVAGGDGIRYTAHDFHPLIVHGLARGGGPRGGGPRAGDGPTSSQCDRGARERLVGELRAAGHVTPSAADEQIGDVIGPHAARDAGARAVNKHQTAQVGHVETHSSEERRVGQ